MDNLSLQNSSLANFIKKNHNIVMEYHKRYYQRTTCMAKTPYEIIRVLFMNALSAAGGNTRLDDKYECLCYFLERTASLKKEKGKFPFALFAECFIDSFDSPTQIVQIRNELIYNSKFKQIRDKKANLFLKEAVLLAGNDVFERFDYKQYEPYLSVPIDKVVRNVCYKLFSSNTSSDNDSQKHDNEIYNLSKQLFPESPIVLDDIWFWGHFSFVRGKFEEANKPMLYCDSNIDEKFISDHKMISKLNEFIIIIKSFRKTYRI